MPRPLKPESIFERDLHIVAPLNGCQYIKIKDTVSINRYNRTIHKEVKRICDAIIITPKHNWFCECKMNYEKLKPHQQLLKETVYQYNGLHVVLRKVLLAKGFVYRIETRAGNWQTTEINEIFSLLTRISI
jgi:hypothetical protein